MTEFYKSFEEFKKINEMKDTGLLNGLGYKLGSIIKNIKELKDGEVYGIKDPGDGLWRAWSLNTIKNNVYHFDEIGSVGETDDELEYSKEELEEFIRDKEICNLK